MNGLRRAGLTRQVDAPLNLAGAAIFGAYLGTWRAQQRAVFSERSESCCAFQPNGTPRSVKWNGYPQVLRRSEATLDDQSFRVVVFPFLREGPLRSIR